MARVIWQDTAVDDLARIYEFVAGQSQSLELADRICDELVAAAQERLELMPNSGSLVQEGRKYGAREIYRHSYRIIYVHRNDVCHVVRCIHSSRDLARQLDPEHWPGPAIDDEGSAASDEASPSADRFHKLPQAVESDFPQARKPIRP